MTALLLLLHAQDERILHALVLRRRRYPNRVMNAITHLGDAWFTVGLSLTLMSGLAPGLRSYGLTAALALVSSHLGVQLLKRSINRERPRLPVGYDSLVHAPDRFSFPSGHAAASLSVALAVARALSPMAGSALLLLAVMVGVSRCYLGVHYPGDVIAGWVLGFAGFLFAAAII